MLSFSLSLADDDAASRFNRALDQALHSINASEDDEADALFIRSHPGNDALMKTVRCGSARVMGIVRAALVEAQLDV